MNEWMNHSMFLHLISICSLYRGDVCQMEEGRNLFLDYICLYIHSCEGKSYVEAQCLYHNLEAQCLYHNPDTSLRDEIAVSKAVTQFVDKICYCFGKIFTECKKNTDLKELVQFILIWTTRDKLYVYWCHLGTIFEYSWKYEADTSEIQENLKKLFPNMDGNVFAPKYEKYSIGILFYITKIVGWSWKHVR